MVNELEMPSMAGWFQHLHGVPSTQAVSSLKVRLESAGLVLKYLEWNIACNRSLVNIYWAESNTEPCVFVVTILSHRALKCLDPRDLTWTLKIWHLKKQNKTKTTVC